MNIKKEVFTIPNLLSLFRILLIPVIVWLYCCRQQYTLALLVLILSGVTDIADGIIARKFNMISDFGKILDPIADKLTQMATLICLLTRFGYMWLPLCVMIVKEVLTGIMGLRAIRKSGVVKGADWHGKVTTVLLYTTMALHMLWARIPRGLSLVLALCCVAMMCLSGLLYWYRNLKQIKGYA